MNTVEQILHLFFNNNLKQSEIAKKLGISKQRVSKVLNEDSRYLLAKESKKQKMLYYSLFNKSKLTLIKDALIGVFNYKLTGLKFAYVL